MRKLIAATLILFAVQAKADTFNAKDPKFNIYKKAIFLKLDEMEVELGGCKEMNQQLVTLGSAISLAYEVVVSQGQQPLIVLKTNIQASNGNLQVTKITTSEDFNRITDIKIELYHRDGAVNSGNLLNPVIQTANILINQCHVKIIK